jgi:hypothetical protein
VKDWGKRIEGYNEKQKNKYQLAFSRMELLKAQLLDKSPDW